MTIANRDDVTYDGDIIEHPANRAPMTLFGTDDPSAVVERASAIATALASIINERKLFATIGGKKHVVVEGWTLLGSMVGVFAEVEWSRPIDDGWEARAVARTLAGNVVGAAEAMCTAREGRWRSADPYAVRSMSQTRAVSKALRLPLGFIMHLAGYSATPAEEIADEQPERGARGEREARQSRAGVDRSAPAPSPEDALRDAIATAALRHGLGASALSLIADRVGVPKGTHANEQQLRAILELIEQPASGVPSAPAGEAGGSVPVSHSDAAPEASIPSGSATPEPGDSPPVTVAPAAPIATPVIPAQAGPRAGEEDGGSGRAPAAQAVTAPQPDGSALTAPEPATPTDAEILAAAGEGAEIVWPKPGTPEYRALPNGTERAKAKAYWDKLKKAAESEDTPAEQMRAALEGE